MSPQPVLLDVRDDLRQGREPMTRILAAARSLAPGQSLCLRTTFEPIPLFRVLGSMGLEHDARRIAEGDWEVTFRPRSTGDRPAAGPAEPAASSASPDGPSVWPAASVTLDNRGLLPPEPMVRVLEALEALPAGEVLEVWNDREPVFLLPELAQRGVEVRREPLGAGVKLRLRRPGAPA